MNSLYSLTNKYQYLLDQLYDHETGEVNQEVEAQIDALQLTIQDKCIAVSSYIKSIESDKAQLEELQSQLTKRKANYEKSIQKWQSYLQENMEKQGIQKIECPYFTIKLRKNPYGTDILDESLIPPEFMNKKEIIKTEIKPDRNRIKETVLKTGEQIPGAFVSQKNRLEILIDKL